MALFNLSEEVIFEKENPGSNQLLIAINETAQGKRIFSIFDTEQDYGYLFDDKGMSVLRQPVETNKSPSLFYNSSSGKLMLFHVFNNDLQFLPLEK